MNSGDKLKECLDKATVLTPEALLQLGTTLVIAPHPDDESLGCGGLIALLTRGNISVHVLFVTDGTGSHRESKQYPAPALMRLRESEALHALSVLGLQAGHAIFMRLGDGRLPTAGHEEFDNAVKKILEVMKAIVPQTLILPWRRDPHSDHRASNQLAMAARQKAHSAMGILEYPLWLWHRGDPDDLPGNTEVDRYRVDVSSTLNQKQLAISMHHSQTTNMISDDPTGFQLSGDVLSYFKQPVELYFGTDIPLI